MLATCRGSGNPGPDSTPTLTAATLVGPAATPAAADRLQLFLSEDVVLAPGALLTDLDVTLSSGTLGAVAMAPTLLNTRTVVVTLGSGVSFTPGSTTITIGSGNDAIADLTGNLAKYKRARHRKQ